MKVSDLLLIELDEEIKKTRATLRRVPAAKAEFMPHRKSTKLGKLAAHVAQLGGFGYVVLTTPSLDFSQSTIRPLQFESGEQLVRAFDEESARVRSALQAAKDEIWMEPWKLSFQGRQIFEGPRFLAYRQMFMNHMVHHRAQLGVYLRLNDEPVPATYGPSADEPVLT